MEKSIGRLDFAVCRVVSKLDELFFGIVFDWKPLCAGLGIEYHERTETRAFAHVHPAIWPKCSWIGIRLDKGIPVEGLVSAQHIRIPGFYGYFRLDFNIKDSETYIEIVEKFADPVCAGLFQKALASRAR